MLLLSFTFIAQNNMQKISKQGELSKTFTERGSYMSCSRKDEIPAHVSVKGCCAAFSNWSSLGVSVSTFHFTTVCEGVKSRVRLFHAHIPLNCSSMFRWWNCALCVYFYLCAYRLGWLGTCDCIQSALLLFLILSYAKVIFLPLLKS